MSETLMSETVTKRELTCIRCPLGCLVEVQLKGGEVISVSGNTCKRGEDYAKSECINPERIITSTIINTNGQPVPVKTDRPIPKDKIFECMQLINSTKIEGSVTIGDIIIKDAFGSNIVAADNHD